MVKVLTSNHLYPDVFKHCGLHLRNPLDAYGWPGGFHRSGGLARFKMIEIILTGCEAQMEGGNLVKYM